MVIGIKLEATSGPSLKSLVTGFVLTKQTEGKSKRTVEYYVSTTEKTSGVSFGTLTSRGGQTIPLTSPNGISRTSLVT